MHEFGEDPIAFLHCSYIGCLEQLDRHPLSISSEEQRFSITSPLRSKGGGIESGTLSKKSQLKIMIFPSNFSSKHGHVM